MIIIADANALLLPFKYKFNIDYELENLVGNHELIIPEPIIGELKKLSKHNRTAKAALKLARSKRTAPSEHAGDASVLDLAIRFEGIILTNDKELIVKATAEGLRTIRLKEGNRLGFDGDWTE